MGPRLLLLSLVLQHTFRCIDSFLIDTRTRPKQRSWSRTLHALPILLDDTTLSIEAFKPIFDNLLANNLIAASSLPLLLLVASATRPPAALISQSSLGSILQGTFLEQASLECCYKASRDGWSAVDFHQCVDDKGSGLVVARTVTGQVFGGYNPSGWRSTDDYYLSSTAFLWTLKGNVPVKLPILPGGNAAIFDYATAGPCFGASDLQIGEGKAAVMGGFAGPDMENVSANAGNLRTCKSSVGGTYDWNDAWPIRGRCQLVEVEVYCKK